MTETQFRLEAENSSAGTEAETAGRVEAAPEGCCPFHDGPETLDGLMAEVLAGAECGEREGILDTALDLRHAMQTRRDAGECVTLLCRLRSQLDGAHYLAFYRVRRWMRRLLAVESSAGRNEPWLRQALPLDCARPDEIEHQCLANWPAHDGCLSSMARVRFVFIE